MFRAALFASLALTAACGGDGSTDDTGGAEMSEADFKAAFETKVCDQTEVCTGSPCTGDEELLTKQTGCTYDAAFAADCLDGDFYCTEPEPGVSVPLACGDAYVCN